MKRKTRGFDRFLLALAVLLVTTLLLGAFMTACAPDEEPPVEPNNGDDNGDGGNEGGDAQVDTEISLRFEDIVASAEVVSSRDILLNTSSNRLLIEGNGSFTVSVDGGEALASVDGKLTIDNTADVHTSVKLTVTVESSMTLSFTLQFDPGTAGNPYPIAETGDTVVAYTKEAFISVGVSGWYSFTGEGYTLTNYSVTSAPMYLVKGLYSLGSDSGDSEETISVTLSATDAPEGYAKDSPVSLTLGEESAVTLYRGVEIFYSFEATKSGIYSIIPGSVGQSVNCRFAVSNDGYGVYYGKYFNDGALETCAGGTECTLYIASGDTVIIKVDYTLSENFVGDDEVAVKVSEVAKENIIEISELDSGVKGELEKRGKVWYTFKATEKGVYSVMFGMGTDPDVGFRFTTTLDEIGTYYGDDDTAILRLAKDEQVWIAVDGESTKTAGEVYIKIEAVKEEPLPAEGWVSGTYEGTFTIVLDRDALTVKHGTFDPVRFYYLDGVATYTVEFSGSSTTYTLRMAENGVDIELSYVRSNGAIKTYTLTYKVEVEPVDVGSFKGVYVDADGNELKIFEDGDGIYYSSDWGYERCNTDDDTFSYADNVISWGSVGGAKISIAEMRDGRVYSVSVNAYGETAIYTLDETKEAVRPPVSLYADAGIGTGITYTGENGYTLSDGYLNEASFVILDKDGSKYTVYGYTPDFDSVVFTLEKDGDDFKIYDSTGVLLDTLTKDELPEPPALLANGEEEDITTCVGKKQDERYLKITKTGWYTFFCDGGELLLDCEMTDGVPTCSFEGTKKTLSSNGVFVKLQKDDLIAVYNCGGVLTASFSKTAPEGTAENPLVMTGDTVDLQKKLSGSDAMYLKYVASEAGKYVISVVDGRMHFVVKDKDYGVYYDDSSWKYVEYPNGAVCTLELAANEELIIEAMRCTSSGPAKISVKPYEEPSEDDGKLEFKGFESDSMGEYSGELSGSVLFIRINADSFDLKYGSDAVSAIAPNYYGTYYTATVTVGDATWNVRFSFDAEGKTVSFSTDGGDTLTVLSENYFTEAQTGTYTYEKDGSSCTVTVSANGVTYSDSQGREVEVTGDKLTHPQGNLNRFQFVIGKNDAGKDITVTLNWNNGSFMLNSDMFTRVTLVRSEG